MAYEAYPYIRHPFSLLETQEPQCEEQLCQNQTWW